MRLYVTESDEKFPEITEKFDIASAMEYCTDVLILPGGLGAIKDLFTAMDKHKSVIIYNKNNYYDSVLKKMFKSTYLEDEDLLGLEVEKDYEVLLRKLEERENGKANNGKSSKLL